MGRYEAACKNTLRFSGRFMDQFDRVSVKVNLSPFNLGIAIKGGLL